MTYQESIEKALQELQDSKEIHNNLQKEKKKLRIRFIVKEIILEQNFNKRLIIL